jgi:beta-lactamase regulating signal transducer with metallopeptidase domain/protocatechuate 3,4-dioxygenase beta subunit
MTWDVTALNWLAHVALGSSCFLIAGSIAVCCWRQPARKVRLIEWTLLGSLLMPGLVALEFLPRWHFGWWRPETPRPASLRESLQPAAAVSVRQSDVVTLVPSPSTQEGIGSAFSFEQPAPRPADDVSLPASSAPVRAPIFSIPMLVLLIYGAVAAVLLVRASAGLGRLFWLCQHAEPASSRVTGVFRAIAGSAGGRVRILVTERIQFPLAFPGWRPIILLPSSLCESGREELRYCLAHEWSHIERGDLRRWYLAMLIQFLYFYQPLFWWLRNQLRLCQDFLADAQAARQSSQAEDYADYLVRIARSGAGIPAAALGINDRHSNLYRRIIMLLQPGVPLQERCGKVWTLLAGIAAIAILTAATALRLDARVLPERSDAAADDQKTKEPATKKDEAKGEALHYSGKVTDKDTGKPVAGATVTVRRSLYGDPEVKREDQIIEETKHTTAKDGKYQFTIPPEQSSKRYLYIELDVEHSEYAPQKHFGYSFQMIRKNEKLGGRPFFESVEIRPGKTISGLVRTPEGNAVAGVKVLAYSRTNKKTAEFEYGSFADTRTDADGRFQLVVTTPGTAVFWILPEKYAPSLHAIKEGKRGDLGAFTLSKGSFVRGQVLDAKGKPLSGINVNAGLADFREELQGLMVADSIRRSAVTNDRGEFELAPLPTGNYRIQPSEHSEDSSKDDQHQYSLPAVFVASKVALKEGSESPPLEIRATPHVVFEAQYVDSHGKPTRGHECFVFGQIDKQPWHAQTDRVDHGTKLVARLPHGLENAQVQLSTNEHGALRWRKGKNGPLQNAQRIDLGTVNDDAKDFEIVRYTAPIIVANAKDKAGHQLKDFKVQVVYKPGRSNKEKNSSFINGVQGDVHFEKQEDGRWKSSQLLPDEDVTLTVTCEGYEPKSMELKLPEAETKELEFVLDKAPEKKEKK